jgi:LysR family transcriptional regulator (chromosome initiation inhibitor)
MLDYAALSAVAAVVREGSFERAARALNVTPSAISQRVKQLEERLGSVLIIRGQPCVATETGRLLCRHVDQVGMLETELRGSLPALGAGSDRVTLRVAVNADSFDTWFIDAMAAFLRSETGGALLDVALDDQDHTVEWLRSGTVFGAVTAHAQPVQGCNSVALGSLTYVASASPGFVREYFRNGVDAKSLARAPALTFNRKDRLQSLWVSRLCRRSVDTPTHWLPSTQAFANASAAGIGWGMNPVALVREQLESGTLVELVPGRTLCVPLFWQHTRLPLPMLDRLTQAIVTTARTTLRGASARRQKPRFLPAT